MAQAAYGAPEPTRTPGDFARHPETGAPYVASLTETRRPKGTKPELLAEAERRGLLVNAKTKVAELITMLGAEPADVMYGRPSSLGKQIENLTNLQKWSERAVALGIFVAPELLAELATIPAEQRNLDDKAARKILDTIAVKAKNAAQAQIAAERGTHTHELAEDFDNEADWIRRAERGEELGIPEDVQRSLVAAWEQALEANGLEILAVEAKVVDDEWRQAGSLDRIARLTRDLTFPTIDGDWITIPAGTVIILDIKTGRIRIGNDGHPDHWLGYAVQIACYAKSKPYDPETRQRGEWPWPIDQRYGIIAHLDVLAALEGNPICRLVLVDLEAGRHAGNLCVASREWEKRRDVFSRVEPAVSPAVPLDEAPAPNTADDQPEAAESMVDLTAEPATEPPTTIATPDPPAPTQDGNPLANVICMRGRCSHCKRTVNLVNHRCATMPAPEPELPDNPEFDVDPPADDLAAAVAAINRREQLRERFRLLSDDQKRAYVKPADTDDLDAVQAAIDAVDPFAVAHELVTDRTDADVEIAAGGVNFAPLALDDGTRAAPEDVASLEMAFATLDTDRKLVCAQITTEARDAKWPISVTALPTVRRWHIARAIIRGLHHGLTYDELVCAAAIIATPDQVRDADNLGALLGRFTLEQADSLYDAVDQPATATAI